MALSFFAPAQLTCSDEPISDEVTLFSCAESGVVRHGEPAVAPALLRRSQVDDQENSQAVEPHVDQERRIEQQ